MNQQLIEQGFEWLTITFHSILALSAMGSLVVLAALAVNWLIEKRTTTRLMYVFWLVVLLRFVWIAAPQSPTSVFNFVSFAPVEVASEAPITSAQILDDRLIFPEPVSNTSRQPLSYERTRNSRSKEDQRAPLLLDGKELLSIIWIIGVGCCFTKLAIGFRKVQHILLQSAEPSKQLQYEFESVKQQQGLGSSATLRISDLLDVPSMTGIFRPVVLLPTWCDKQFDSQSKRLILAHELVHIRRFDGAVRLLTQLIITIHWFNPLVRVVAIKLESNRELSCDIQVVRLMSNLVENGSRQYGHTILEVAERAAQLESSELPESAFVSGFIQSNEDLLKQRIAMLVQEGKSKRIGSIVAVTLMSVLLAVGYTNAQTSRNSPAQTDAASKTEVEPTLLEPGVSAQIPKRQSLSTVPMIRLHNGEPIEFLADTPVTPVLTERIHRLSVGETKRIRVGFPVAEVMVKDAKIVEATPISPDELVIKGVARGTSMIEFVNQFSQVVMLKAVIVPDVADLKNKIEEAFPDAHVQVEGTSDGFAVLWGTVTSDEVVEIEKFAVKNCELPIKNELSDKAPVAINIKVYEISNSKLEQLGVDWSKHEKGLPKKITSFKELLPNNGGTANRNTMAFGRLESASQVAPLLSKLEKNNIAKLVDQPTIITLDGKQAAFQSGGEIPILVSNENGKKQIEFRSFGTKVLTTPHVHNDQQLTLEVIAEVSEIDEELSNSEGVPGFRVRRLNTGIRMKMNETIALVGDYRRNGPNDKEDTELVFLITPKTIGVAEMPVQNESLTR